MIETRSIVYIIDDDPDLRESLVSMVQSLGIATQSFPSATAFLATYSSTDAGCVVSDVRMPEMSGLELFERLTALGNHMPVILMTAFADVQMAIRALKAGAAEFVEKPFNAQVMLERIQGALANDRERRKSTDAWEQFGQHMSELTEKERETLHLLVAGSSNKVMATQLDITERAIEMRRASVMKKLQVHSLAELIRQVTQYEMLFPKRK